MINPSFNVDFATGAGSVASGPVQIQRRITIFVLTMAGLTLFLMALGSATRVMNAGLSCPDWPLCYGELLPRDQMNLRVFLEWFHRLIATGMGLLTLTLLGVTLWFRTHLPRWMPGLAVLAVALVIFQGILGGLTVTELLRFDIVTAHLGTGLFFFATLLTMGILLWPQPQMTAVPVGRLPWIGSLATGLVYGQSLLGGLVASQWALHQCFGNQQLCSVMNSHLIGIAPATLATLWLCFRVWRTSDLSRSLRLLGLLAGISLLLQLLLGLATFHLHLQVEPLTVAHQAVGAMLLGSLVAFTVLAFRHRSLTHASVA